MSVHVEKPMKKALLAFAAALAGAYAWQIVGHVVGTVYYQEIHGLDRAAAIKAVGGSQSLQMAFYVGMELILGLVVYGFVTKSEKRNFTWETVGLKKGAGGFRLWWIGASLAFGMNVIIWGSAVQLGYTGLESTGFSLHSVPAVFAYAAGMALYGAFPGFFEEILFRGYIQERLTAAKGRGWAIAITSVLFAVIHLGRYSSPVVLVYLIVMSVFISLLYVATKSLHACIGFHFAWDYLGSLVTAGQDRGVLLFRAFTPEGEQAMTLLMIAVILLTMVSLGLIRRNRGRRELSQS